MHVWTMAAFCLTIGLIGCSERNADTSPQGTLRFLYSSEDNFYYNFGDVLAVKFPDVQVEIIPTAGLSGPTYTQDYEQLIREQQPDLLMIYNQNQYRLWADNGLLLDLSPYARRKSFDLDAFSPAVLDLLKTNNESKLFGLAPSLNSSALYYNKDLFDQYGVPYPVNRMSWDETLQLARRFPVDPDPDKRIYGFHAKYTTPFDIVTYMTDTEDISYLSSDGKTVTFHTPVWEKRFKQVVDGFRSGHLYYYYKDGKPISYGPEETRQMDLFSAKRAAMMLSNTDQMFRLQQQGVTDMNWDIVTVPVDPANPDMATYLHASPIYAIAAGAENPELAWKFIAYFNSEEAAKVSQKIDNVLSTRTAFQQTKDGRDLEPFYALKRRPVDLTAVPPVPAGFSELRNLQIRIIHEAVTGAKTAEEALQSLQTEGQALLNQAWMQEAKKE